MYSIISRFKFYASKKKAEGKELKTVQFAKLSFEIDSGSMQDTMPYLLLPDIWVKISYMIDFGRCFDIDSYVTSFATDVNSQW